METVETLEDKCIQAISELLIDGDSRTVAAFGMLHGGTWLYRIVSLVLETAGYHELEAQIKSLQASEKVGLAGTVAMLEEQLTLAIKEIAKLSNDLRNSESALTEMVTRSAKK